ncbi:unnamed protein product [Strongylus vulgaris]|uniref:Uncharacterized protein n=1 Tax=Strongylus vulgaris TaxID=40348 RepID=A0A3P7LH76_STRVU|nr:unnamed protein product [Strongylus vulgaris]
MWHYEDWRNCFLVHAILLLLCNGIFCIWADARPASWTSVVDEKADGEEMLERGGANGPTEANGANERTPITN